MTDLSNIEIFTVTEVNERLPLVRRVMHDLRDAWIRRRDASQSRPRTTHSNTRTLRGSFRPATMAQER